jgi:hypothetical protein
MNFDDAQILAEELGKLIAEENRTKSPFRKRED